MIFKLPNRSRLLIFLLIGSSLAAIYVFVLFLLPISVITTTQQVLVRIQGSSIIRRNHSETLQEDEQGEEDRWNNNIHNDSYDFLQRCVDDYTSNGFWNGTLWQVADHPPACRFHAASNSTNNNNNSNNNNDNNNNNDELASTLALVKIGFMGDSTTRSDLRAWETHYKCPRTNFDESQIFQRKNERGGYLCRAAEQTINLTKCGIPPIINVTDCPRDSGVMFRYFYKIYPWTPLDQWYLSEQQHSLFQDLDVLVISLGRWFVYYEPRPSFDVAQHFETFLIELKKVYSGMILYQSEYPYHMAKSADIRYPVPCTPRAICNDCGDTDQYECSQTDEADRPQSDMEMRAVLKRHRILHLDRWNVSKTLPLEYFLSWYCHNGTVHQWYCSHHLHFVALQHMRLIAHVIRNLWNKT